MSDGHFNRAFLPRNDYQSALKVGKAMERKRCEEALAETLEEFCQENASLREQIMTGFKEKLRQ